MAWIELHQSLVRHPKVLRVSAALRVSEEAVIGHLATLWCWALDAKPQGGPLSALDVRAGANWKARTDIVAALVDARLLDERDDGLWLHDWPEYAGRLVRQREMAKDRARKARATHPHAEGTVQETYAYGARNVREQFAPTVPNPTEPSFSHPPTPLRTGLTDEQERLRLLLHAQVRDLVLGGRDAPDVAWCVDFIERGATKSDIEYAVQASLGKGTAYVRKVLESRVIERENGVDHDQLARDRAAAAAREPHAGSSRPRGVEGNRARRVSEDVSDFGDAPPGAIRASGDSGREVQGVPGVSALESVPVRIGPRGITR